MNPSMFVYVSFYMYYYPKFDLFAYYDSYNWCKPIAYQINYLILDNKKIKNGLEKQIKNNKEIIINKYNTVCI